jgi:hypothetical protein
MFIYSIDKKTGKKIRITVPDWDYPIAVNNPVAPPGQGTNIAMGSHAAGPILSLSASIYVWSFSFFDPINWLLQTSITTGSIWTTNTTISGSIYLTGSTASAISANTGVAIIGVDASGNPLTGRSNVIYI